MSAWARESCRWQPVPRVTEGSQRRAAEGVGIRGGRLIDLSWVRTQLSRGVRGAYLTTKVEAGEKGVEGGWGVVKGQCHSGMLLGQGKNFRGRTEDTGACPALTHS